MSKRVADTYLTALGEDPAVPAPVNPRIPTMATAAQLARRKIAQPKGRSGRSGIGASSAPSAPGAPGTPASSAPSVFGQLSNTTAANNSSNTTSNATANSNNIFKPTTNIFGSANIGSANNMFSATTQPQSAFGSSAQNNNVFGSATQTNNIFGGQSQSFPPAKAGSGFSFGSSTQNNTAPTSFAFGSSTQDKNVFGGTTSQFSNPNGNASFGTTPTSSAGGGFGFGQPQLQMPQANPNAGLFFQQNATKGQEEKKTLEQQQQDVTMMSPDKNSPEKKKLSLAEYNNRQSSFKPMPQFPGFGNASDTSNTSNTKSSLFANSPQTVDKTKTQQPNLLPNNGFGMNNGPATNVFGSVGASNPFGAQSSGLGNASSAFNQFSNNNNNSNSNNNNNQSPQALFGQAAQQPAAAQPANMSPSFNSNNEKQAASVLNTPTALPNSAQQQGVPNESLDLEGSQKHRPLKEADASIVTAADDASLLKPIKPGHSLFTPTDSSVTSSPAAPPAVAASPLPLFSPTPASSSATPFVATAPAPLFSFQPPATTAPAASGVSPAQNIFSGFKAPSEKTETSGLQEPAVAKSGPPKQSPGFTFGTTPAAAASAAAAAHTPAVDTSTTAATTGPVVSKPVFAQPAASSIPSYLNAEGYKEFDNQDKLRALNRAFRNKIITVDVSSHDIDSILRAYVAARSSIGADIGLYQRHVAGTKRKADTPVEPPVPSAYKKARSDNVETPVASQPGPVFGFLAPKTTSNPAADKPVETPAKTPEKPIENLFGKPAENPFKLMQKPIEKPTAKSSHEPSEKPTANVPEEPSQKSIENSEDGNVDQQQSDGDFQPTDATDHGSEDDESDSDYNEEDHVEDEDDDSSADQESNDEAAHDGGDEAAPADLSPDPSPDQIEQEIANNPNKGLSLFDRITVPSSKDLTPPSKDGSSADTGDNAGSDPKTPNIFDSHTKPGWKPGLKFAGLGNSTPEPPTFSPFTPDPNFKPATTFNFNPPSVPTTNGADSTSVLGGAVAKVDSRFEGMFGSRPSTPIQGDNRPANPPATAPAATLPAGDNTWKQGSPIKFGASVTLDKDKPAQQQPLFSFTAASPSSNKDGEDSAKPLGTLFGKPAPGATAKTDGSLGFTFGQFSTTSDSATTAPAPAPGFLGVANHLGFGGSATSSALSSRQSSPGITDNEESAATDVTDSEAAPPDEQAKINESRAGEEEEECVYEVSTVKALRLVNKKTASDKEPECSWVTVGQGPLRLLKNKDGKTRLLIRNTTNGNPIVNEYLLPKLEWKVQQQNGKTGALKGALVQSGILSQWVIKIKLGKEQGLCDALEEQRKAQ